MQVCLALWFVLGTQYLKTVGGSYNSFWWSGFRSLNIVHVMRIVRDFYLRLQLLCYVLCYTSSYLHCILCLFPILTYNRLSLELMVVVWQPQVRGQYPPLPLDSFHSTIIYQSQAPCCGLHLLCYALNRLKQVDSIISRRRFFISLYY